MEILEKALKAEKENRPYALATIVKTAGNAPRSAGTKMIVYGDGTFEGTVGGSLAEHQAIKDCLEAIKTGKTALKEYSPATLGDACKKNLTVFIEPGGIKPYLYIMGSGHVARAVLPYASKAGFAVTVIDTRDVSEDPEIADYADSTILVDSFGDVAGLELAADAFFLICSYSHENDCLATVECMKKDPRYLGIIGGPRKFLVIFRALREAGISEEKINAIYAPVGLDIGGETPAEIGIGVTAELMMVKNNRSGRPLRDCSKEKRGCL